MTAEKAIISELRPRAERLCKERGWTLGEALGAGATAPVFEVQTADGERALKIYASRFLKGKSGAVVRARFQIVLDHLQQHDCSHLVTVFEGGEFEGTLFMLMQRAPGKMLTDVLKLVPRERIRDLVRQVAIAAKYLEDKKLCHRDIKSDNIVVSEDFRHATLLDLGVVRWLDDDGGSGTDDGGQLPFVATARYSSPEYMFRLMPPGPELWRALTFYQLGAVLHDLINREPLFEDVVQRAKDNRYLVAHAVATISPKIEASEDVPLDLILLAQRALQKDPVQRLASVGWEDFVEESRRRQNEFLLGIRKPKIGCSSQRDSAISELARELEQGLDEKLSGENVHCRHAHEIINNNHAELHFDWVPNVNSAAANPNIAVKFMMAVQGRSVSMTAQAEIKQEHAQINSSTIKTIPPLDLGSDQLALLLIEHSYNAFLDASAEVVASAGILTGQEARL